MLPDDAYYNRGQEQQRLSRGTGKLEFARTQEILLHYLPPPPVRILDIGGGAGVYALWLARLGYEVHLIDLVQLHIEQAQQASENQSDHPLASVQQGDARQIDWSDSSADVILMLGPLYHLPDKTDRLRALGEAWRVLAPKGIIFTAAISRFASLFDGLARGFLADPEFADIVEQDLSSGQHWNPTNHPNYFTTAYFHYPTEMGTELETAGFRDVSTLAVEGPGWLAVNFDAFWSEPHQAERLLRFVRMVERDPAIIGVSSHLICVGHKT